MLDVATLTDQVMAMATRGDRAGVLAAICARDSSWRDHLENAAAGFGALWSMADVEAMRRVAALNHEGTRAALRLPPAQTLKR